MITDMNGVQIIPGQTVLVHKEEETREALVTDIFPDQPTVNEPGFWVDINFGDGLQGMMSYIIEVKNNKSLQQASC